MRDSADIIELYVYLFKMQMCCCKACHITLLCCPFCSVGAVTGLCARRPKNRILASVRDFFVVRSVYLDLLWGPLGFLLGPHSPGLKWQWRVFDHSSRSGAQVKNEWRFTSALSWAFMACTGTTWPSNTRILGVRQLLLDHIIVTALTVMWILYNKYWSNCNYIGACSCTKLYRNSPCRNWITTYT
jgi:hypothetical protein